VKPEKALAKIVEPTGNDIRRIFGYHSISLIPVAEMSSCELEAGYITAEHSNHALKNNLVRHQERTGGLCGMGGCNRAAPNNKY